MKKPLSIYIHIPFCERKCAYCDFVSFDNKSHLIDEYVNALCKEILSFISVTPNQANSGRVPMRPVVSSVFIGGGTPSLLEAAQISKIFEALRQKFIISSTAEITIEANPNSITKEKLAYWLKSSINRLSIGVQSFDDSVLKTLGRIHTVSQAVDAIKLGHSAGFSNINIDLIHSVPVVNSNLVSRSQNMSALEEILPLVTHVSAYSLIIEPGTPFNIHKPVDDAVSLSEQKEIEKVLTSNGFAQYEVSAFARPGFKCRHNQAYWQPQKCEYIGFGLSAHSLYNNQRFANTAYFDIYLSDSFRTEKPHTRASSEIAAEIVMLGLRTKKGVALNDLLSCGFDILKEKHSEIELLLKAKLIKFSKNRVYTTKKGFLLLNRIIEKLAP